MASLMVFRKKIVPSDTNYGDDIAVAGPGKSEVSENLTEQVNDGNFIYRTSVDFESGSTMVYLNGLYMTNGNDYKEYNNKKIKFINYYKDNADDIFFKDSTVISIRYKAK